MINYLKYQEILDAYRHQMNRYGGYCAIRDNNVLLSAIANPQRVFAGVDLYPTLAEKAAILVYSLNMGQPFVDGNKRISFICGRLFLRINGHDVTSLEEYCKLIENIANGSATKEDVSDWFRLNIDKLENIGTRINGELK